MLDWSSDPRLLALTKNRYWREDDAAYVLDAMEASGLSLSGFARRLGVNGGRLRRWRSRLGGRSGPAFHPVQLVFGGAELRETRLGIEPEAEVGIELCGGRRLVVRTGFDPALVRDVAAMVESWPC